MLETQKNMEAAQSLAPNTTSLANIASASDNEADESNNETNEAPQEKDEESKETDVPEFYQEGTIRMVGVYIGVEKLNHINVVTQSFACSFKVGMLWHASEKDWENWNKDKVTYVPEFVPRFEAPNILALEKQELLTDETNTSGYKIFQEGSIDNWGMPLTDLRFPYLNACTWTIEGVFSESFEIERFPMDCQDLQIAIVAQGCTLDKCIFVPSLSRDEVIADLDLKYGDHDEYEFHEPIMEYDKVQWDEDGDGNKINYAVATMRIKMSRKYMIHLWKIGFSSFFITLSSLICFTFDLNEHLDARISHIFTMLLTMVAFQFIVQQKLPAISYLTRLDQYMLFAMFFLFLVAVVVALNAIFDAEEEFDHGCGYTLLIFLFICNFIFCIVLYYDRKLEVTKLTMTTKELDDFQKGQIYGNKDDEEEDDPNYLEVPKTGVHIEQMVQEALNKDIWSDVLNSKEKKE